MEQRMLHHAMMFLFCVLLIPEKASPESIRTTTVQKDTGPGNVPIVNPTTPGSTPIVNPAAPLPPATTGPPTTGPGSPGGAWCVANPSASPTALQVALDYACGYGGADCSALQPNGPCYDPNTVADHASYAFNDYYQKNPIPTSCVFGGTAQLSYTDPSRGNCHFATPTTTPTTPTAPIVQPPPSPTVPTVPYTPVGGDTSGTEPTDNDYGGDEPTGSPNSSHTVSSNLVLLTTVSCLVIAMAIHD